MNTTDKTKIDETTREAQERGMRAAPRTKGGGLDPAVATYRVVAEALVSMPRRAPPDDFATDIVKRVARRDAGLELPLLRVLAAVFLLASVIVGVLCGEQWWQLLSQTLGGDALGLVLAGMGCLTLSWMGNRALVISSHTREPEPGVVR